MKTIKKFSHFVNEEVELDEVRNPHPMGSERVVNKPGHDWHGKKVTILRGKKHRWKSGVHGASPSDDSTMQSDHFKSHELVKEGVELDELNIPIKHNRFERSHGKSPKGSGNWMFTHKQFGRVDYNDKTQVHHYNGSLTDAKKSARDWAKEHGHSSVYVMEEIELDEGVSKLTRKELEAKWAERDRKRSERADQRRGGPAKPLDPKEVIKKMKDIPDRTKLGKSMGESLDVSHAGGGGSGKHEYHKWGKSGQVDGWKKHVTSIHPKAKFTDKEGKLAKKTHAHVGDKEVGSYSHYNHSSSTLKEGDYRLPESYSVDDHVVPSKGPHKGVKHRVIHAHDDGEHYNIQPIGIKPYKIAYRLGAAKAHKSDLKPFGEEVERIGKSQHIHIVQGNPVKKSDPEKWKSHLGNDWKIVTKAKDYDIHKNTVTKKTKLIYKEETLDELDTVTLQQYKTKADKDIDRRFKKSVTDDSEENKRKIANRAKGYARASTRLTDRVIGRKTFEEVENLDEVSRKTLSDYIRKAEKDIQYNKDKATYAYKVNNLDNVVKHHNKAVRLQKQVDKAKEKFSGKNPFDEEVEQAPVTFTGGHPIDKKHVYKLHIDGEHEGTYHSKKQVSQIVKNRKKTSPPWRKYKVTRHARSKLSGPVGNLPEEYIDENEQVDELSTDLLKRYVNKASKDTLSTLKKSKDRPTGKLAIQKRRGWMNRARDSIQDRDPNSYRNQRESVDVGPEPTAAQNKFADRFRRREKNKGEVLKYTAPSSDEKQKHREEVLKKGRAAYFSSDKYKAQLAKRKIKEESIQELSNKLDEYLNAEAEEHDAKEIGKAVKEEKDGLKGSCWKDYVAIGTKKKNGKTVPNCVPKK